MTDTLIPYSFIPGTKAKAQEVNANFIALANSITENTATLSSTKLNKDLSNITETGVNFIKSNTAPPRNIGEIVASTIPLTDAGLHLLDGSLISGSGSYADFVTHIAGLVTEYPDLFETEANWQTSVTDYGVCGKFVYDDVNNTVRLPKYSNKIYTKEITSTAPVKGTGKALGLSNGTNLFGIQGGSGSGLLYGQTGSYGLNIGASQMGASNIDANKVIGVTTDDTKSGIISDLSNITTALDGYWYIVIANATKTDIQIDIDEIATDLNGKADTDFSNVSDTGSSKVAGWAMPGSTYVDLTLGASGTTYTAPADGWVQFSATQTATNGWIAIYNQTTSLHTHSQMPNVGNFIMRIFAPVSKGQIFTLDYASVNSTVHRFIYAKGSESEVS